MNATASGSELSSAISLCMSAVETRTTIPELSFLRIATAPHALELIATDLEVQIAARVPALVKEPGSVAIPAKLAHQQIRSMGDGEISIVGDKAKCRTTLSRNGTKSRIAGIDPERCSDMAGEPEGDVLDCTVAGDDLAFLLRSTLYCCPDVEAKWSVPAVLLRAAQGQVQAETVDGRRMSRAYCKATCNVAGTVLIPRKAALVLAKVGCKDAGVSITATKRQATVAVPDVLMTARLMDANFPDMNALFPDVSRLQKATFQTGSMISALECAMPFASENLGEMRRQDRSARVDLDFGDGIKVMGVGDSGDAESVVVAEGTYDPQHRSFNGLLWMDFLRSHDESHTTLFFVPERRAIELRPGDGSQDVYRAMIAEMWR